MRVARIANQLARQTLPQYSHPKNPHHFTLPQMAACVLLMFYLDLSYWDLDEIEPKEEAIASDSTGFTPEQSGLYYQTRRGRLYKAWLKGVYAVGVISQFILTWRSGQGLCSDAP